MSIKELEKIVTKAQDADGQIVIEDKVRAMELYVDLGQTIEGFEVFVEEPDDLFEPDHVFSKAELNAMREAQVVAIANELGIDASIRDKKADTVQKILDFQKE